MKYFDIKTSVIYIKIKYRKLIEIALNMKHRHGESLIRDARNNFLLVRKGRVSFCVYELMLIYSQRWYTNKHTHIMSWISVKCHRSIRQTNCYCSYLTKHQVTQNQHKFVIVFLHSSINSIIKTF